MTSYKQNEPESQERVELADARPAARTSSELKDEALSWIEKKHAALRRMAFTFGCGDDYDGYELYYDAMIGKFILKVIDESANGAFLAYPSDQIEACFWVAAHNAMISVLRREKPRRAAAAEYARRASAVSTERDVADDLGKDVGDILRSLTRSTESDVSDVDRRRFLINKCEDPLECAYLAEASGDFVLADMLREEFIRGTRKLNRKIGCRILGDTEYQYREGAARAQSLFERDWESNGA